MIEHKLVCIRRCQKTPSHCEKAHELPEYQENQDKTTGHYGRSALHYFVLIILKYHRKDRMCMLKRK